MKALPFTLGIIIGLILAFGYYSNSKLDKLQLQTNNILNTITTYKDNNIPKNIPFRDYQIEVVEDTLLVYDLNRLVGKCFYEDYDKGIGEIIMKDNQ